MTTDKDASGMNIFIRQETLLPDELDLSKLTPRTTANSQQSGRPVAVGFKNGIELSDQNLAWRPY